MKKQIRQKKLEVKTETVRQLANQELASAAGGGIIYVPGITMAQAVCHLTQ